MKEKKVIQIEERTICDIPFENSGICVWPKTLYSIPTMWFRIQIRDSTIWSFDTSSYYLCHGWVWSASSVYNLDSVKHGSQYWYKACIHNQAGRNNINKRFEIVLFILFLILKGFYFLSKADKLTLNKLQIFALWKFEIILKKCKQQSSTGNSWKVNVGLNNVMCALFGVNGSKEDVSAGNIFGNFL